MAIKLEPIYQDDYVLAINKPSGLLSIKDRAGSIDNAFDILSLEYHDLRVLHRIDRDTSGVIIFAKSEESHKRFSLLFQNNKITKKYLAITNSKPINHSGIIDAKIAESKQNKGTYIVSISRNAKEAQTRYKVLYTNGIYSIIEFELITGRTHQIRVHSKHIGCPLAYDTVYNPMSGVYLSKMKKGYIAKKNIKEVSYIKRLSLHSHSLEFEHPYTKLSTTIEAEVPLDFEKSFKLIRKF